MSRWVKQGTVVIRNLDRNMKRAQATNITLAEAAGVSPGTVEKARKGKPIRKSLAAYISQALKETKFKYKKRGYEARPKRTFDGNEIYC